MWLEYYEYMYAFHGLDFEKYILLMIPQQDCSFPTRG